MDSMGHDRLPADVRGRAEAGLRDLLTRNQPRPLLADEVIHELVDGLSKVSSDGQLEDWLLSLNQHLAELPEVERKARMYDVVMLLGLLDPE
jgi:hypothetical protein